MSEESLFHRAMEKPPGERAAFLEQACGDDTTLRQHVEALLRAHDSPGSFLARPVLVSGETLDSDENQPNPETAVVQPAADEPAARIGPYRLLQQLGEGGMGTVWLAEQREPVQRRVALKIIKQGMDSGQVLARFEAERQALALMDHPNIARVFDGGTTANGRPYFVMELIKGVPFTRYCDEHHLTPGQRLELFVPVCQAVQHAHQKGIIHRDLKPSNVLVTLYDGKPVPKVIDFGIAKATGAKLTERTLFTEFGAVVGTLEYMSPEQAEISQLDIDTRSDVYSLGVLLYELLTGTTPLERKRLKEAALVEVLRLIREEEPPWPSTRLSTTEELPTIAANRGLEPGQLSGLVRGELDWMVMKALEKDRNRRYETASAFAADVQRYLHDEPVLACPPSAGYRLRKFVRRNKGPVLAAALVTLSLVFGLLASLYFAFLAEGRARDYWAAKGQADTEADKARTNEAQAIAARDRARRALYVARMTPMWRFWQEGKLTTVRELLLELRPEPGEPDVRGWEWHYQWRLAHPELRLLEGHQPRTLHREEKTMAFSPDGRWLVSSAMGTASTDLIVWDLAVGKELRRLRDPARNMNQTRCLAFSPDGKTLASGEGCGIGVTVRLWDVPSGRLLHTLEGHDKESGAGVSELAFSPDGRQLASLVNFDTYGPSIKPKEHHYGGTVKLWDVVTGRELHTWQTRIVRWLSFLPNGQVLTVGTAEKKKEKVVVAFHEAATGKEVRSFPTDSEKYTLNTAASADGRWLAVADDDGLRLFDAESGKLARGVMKPPINPLNGSPMTLYLHALALSPDGRRLATAEDPGIVKVYDVQTGKPLTTFRVVEPTASVQPTGVVICVAFSPDGQRLAAQGDDGPIRIFDSQASEGEVRTFRAAPQPRSPAFTPDGERLVALVSGTNQPRLWDAVSGHELPSPRGGGGPVAYSPDGRWLAAKCDEGIRIWDATTWRELRTISGIPRVVALDFGPQGRLAAVTQGQVIAQGKVEAASVAVWDAASGQKLLTLKGHAEFVHGFAFSPDGRQLAVVSRGKDQSEAQLKVWDAATGQELSNVTARFNPRPGAGLAYSPDGRLLASTEPGAVRLRDAATGKEVRSFEESAVGVAFSPDGRWLATAGVRAEVRIWDLAEGEEVCRCQARAGTARNLAFSPDGRWLVATGLDAATKCWEVPTGRERPAAEAPWPIQDFGVAFSPDGTRLVLGTADARAVRVTDAATGAEVRTLGWHPRAPICLAISPDARTVASGGADRIVRLWDAEMLEPLQVFRGHTAPVLVVAFSPDGRLLASGDSGGQARRVGDFPSGEVRVWDAAGGQELHRFLGPPTRGMLAMAFSADGRQLAVVGGEGTVKVWDLERGQELHTGKGPFNLKPEEWIKAELRLVAAFSPDRRRSPSQDLPEGTWLLACAGADNRIHLWDLSANREVGVLTGHGDTKATALTFSPDGRRLVSASSRVKDSQGTIRFWDMVTRQELYAFPHDNWKINGLAFSPDGRRLAAAGDRLLMWDSGPLTPEEAAVEREALGLLDWLFSRPLPRQEVLQRLRSHPAVTEAVRERALRLAERYRE
jgi:WD40 repeat protein/serine/threonine protein kinase